MKKLWYNHREKATVQPLKMTILITKLSHFGKSVFAVMCERTAKKDKKNGCSFVNGGFPQLERFQFTLILLLFIFISSMRLK